jgi:twitching motility protein PilT
MILDDLFKIAVEKNASDIHLVVGRPPILRIDGKLQEIKEQPVVKPKDTETMALSVLDEDQKKKFLQTHEMDLSYGFGKLARFRVNLFREKANIALVARTIPEKIPTMEDIIMPEIVYKLTRLPQGLILVTGPTGCGKTTSLAAMIDFINEERAEHIVTLEDPIEFVFKAKKSIIVQRELGRDMVSFREALKHVVRQDPNVIMVGEMRDLETIATTITLAETGHLVLATLHTLNAHQTVDRIIDIFPPHQQNQIKLQLSMSLRGVISQLLLPKVGGGRIAAREIMLNTPAIANLIRENKIAQIRSVIQTSSKEKMVTMDQDLKRLAREGLISHETAKHYMFTPEGLEEKKKK